MTSEKPKRGRPPKPGGAMSSAERARRWRQRQAEEREQLEAELAFLDGFETVLPDTTDESGLAAEVERLRERDRGWQLDVHDLTRVVADLLNRLGKHDIEAARRIAAQPFLMDILPRFGISIRTAGTEPAPLSCATETLPATFTKNTYSGFAENDVAVTISIRPQHRNEVLVVTEAPEIETPPQSQGIIIARNE